MFTGRYWVLVRERSDGDVDAAERADDDGVETNAIAADLPNQEDGVALAEVVFFRGWVAVDADLVAIGPEAGALESILHRATAVQDDVFDSAGQTPDTNLCGRERSGRGLLVALGGLWDTFVAHNNLHE